MDKNETLLDEVRRIVYGGNFSEERNYPPFTMDNVAKAASAILKKNITSYDVSIIMVMVKLDRDGFAAKKDNILDAVAYLMNAYETDKETYLKNKKRQ